MPLTRRSAETPVRATRSQGLVSQKTPTVKNTGVQKPATPRVESKNVEKANSKGVGTKCDAAKNFKKDTLQADEKTSSGTEVTATTLRKGRGPKHFLDGERAEVEEKTELPDSGSAEGETVQSRGQRAKKRPAESSEPYSAKKQKPSKEDEAQVKPAEVFSPRRSSRAVVPNSRYKDMELLGKRKPAAETKPSSRAKDKNRIAVKKENEAPSETEEIKMDYTDISVQLQQSEQEVVTEEIITEETPIDAQAQMNLFDEVLVLPQTAANPHPSSSLHHILPAAGNESNETSSSTVPSTKFAEEAVVSSSPEATCSAEQSDGQTNSRTVVEAIPDDPYPTDISESEISTVEAAVVSAEENVGSKQACPVKISAPQVIVVKSSSTAWKDKTGLIDKMSHAANLIPKYDDKKMQLAEQVLKTNRPFKPIVIGLGPNEVKKRPRKIIVTPTHTARNEANKKAKAAEKMHQDGTKVTEIPGKSLHSSFLNPKPESSVIKSGEIIHTPDRSSGDLKPVTMSETNISCETEVLDFDETYVATPLNESVKVKLETGSTESNPSDEAVVKNEVDFGSEAIAVTEPAPPPEVSIVYVKAKSKPKQSETASMLRYELVKSPTRIAQLERETTSSEETLHTTDDKKNIREVTLTEVIVNVGADGLVISDESDSVTQLNEVAEAVIENDGTIGNENVVTESGSEAIPEGMNVPDDTSEVVDENVDVTLEEGNQIGEMGEPEDGKKSADEKMMSSLCQVIPVEQNRESQQTAIEYVMFGDKMVPIHKPMSKAHGRVAMLKPHIQKRHGRVESGGQGVGGVASSGLVKKIPLNAAQSAISSVLAQMGEKEQTPVVLNSVEIMGGLPETADSGEQVTEAGVEEGTTEPPTRVIHGYIDRSSGTIGPTQIVEISQDLFAKEVYGEAATLDQVSGEIIPESITSMASSVSMEVDATNSVVSMATAVSTEEDQKATSTHDVESSEQSEEGTNVSEGVVQVVSSLPLEMSSQPGADALPAEDQSADPKTKSTEATVQTIEIVNVSAEALLRCSEELPGSVTAVTAQRQTSSTGGLDTIEPEYTEPADPKVTTHYNEDGSMVIRIESTSSEPNKRVSMVTVPNVIKVKSSKAGVAALQQKKTPHYSQSNMVGYKKLTDVKINPAIGVRKDVKISREATGTKSSVNKQQGQAVSMSTSTQTQKEIETQTENTDEEENDEDDEEEEEEEQGIEVQESEVEVTNDKNQVKRTTKMTVREDGQLQEYVVVSLPEGVEIKQSQARQNIRDPVHDEIVTMGEDGMYICIDCNHKTDKKSNWYKHRRKHLGIRPHACSRCNYKAATSSNLKRHMQIHDDIRNFVCNICNLLFRQKIHLERHIKYKHQEKKIKCPLCDYLCSSENPDLKIHIRRRHMPHEGGSMGAFTCEECGLMTVSKKDLKQHMKFHKKGPELKLFCEFCSFVTDCESRLRRHMLIHTKEKPFQCGLCSYRASQKEHVLRHMRSQHDIEVERKPRRSLLEDEQKEKRRQSLLEGAAVDYGDKDPGESSEDADKPFEKSDYSRTDKIFACNHCSMKFSKLINLYKHLYVQHKQVMPDTGSNDFQCVVCEFRTNNKKNLLVHMRKHNMQDHTPPSHVYSCVLCRYINPRRRNLFQHMKKKHGIEIVMQEDGSNCYVTSDNTSVVFGNQPGEPNVMALSEIVTTETIDEDSPLQIVTEDGSTFQGERISIDNIISVDDMASYVSVSQDQHSPQATVVTTSLYPSVTEHEAAEAIEGLQALAQQPGVLETQTIDNDITTEIVTSEMLVGEEVMTEEESLIEQVEDPGIQLSSEQINQLSSGDYVEINGEVYKVEIAQEGVAKV